MINIGDMDTMVVIQSMTKTIGAQGQKIWTASTHSTVWGKVEQLVDEAVGDGNLEANSSIRLTIYKIPGLTTRWRVAMPGKVYEITSVDPISRTSQFCVLTLHAIDA